MLKRPLTLEDDGGAAGLCGARGRTTAAGLGLAVGLTCRVRRGDAPPARCGPSWGVARPSASYNAVRFTPKVRHIAAVLAPPCRAVRVAASFSSLMAWGRPPRFPRRFAAAKPALMRSCVKARSYGASAPNTLSKNAPCG